MYEFILKNGNIIDGTGKKAYQGDIGIIDGRITYVGPECEGQGGRVIDCTDKCISPGFIDNHSHGDFLLGEYFPALSKLSQGITTEIAGSCGFSMAPVSRKRQDLFFKSASFAIAEVPENLDNYAGFKKFTEHIRNTQLYLNCKLFVGHANLRIAAIGSENRKPTAQEMELMKAYLREAMENGALGLSSGLIYTPAAYARQEEFIELCKVVAEYGGLYATHIRNESSDIVNAVREAIDTAKAADVSLLISHHKIAGEANWGLSKDTLELIDDAIQNGMEIMLDQYPYQSGLTNLTIMIPPRFMEGGPQGLVEKLKVSSVRDEIRREMINPTIPFDNFYDFCGGFGNVIVAWSPDTPQALGKTIVEYAKELGQDEFDTFFDLLIENKGEGTGIFVAMGDEDMNRIISYPYTAVGTDGTPITEKHPLHPRSFGAFPRAIRLFVKERKLMPLEEMIRKITSFPASRMKLKHKGRLSEGYDADITVFDFDEISDRATVQNPKELSSGIEYVFVRGKVAFSNGKITEKGLGRLC